MEKNLVLVCALVFLLLIPAHLPASVYYPGFENFAEEPRAGRFLVASRKMRFSRFHETVIFLTRHDQKGTVGVVINRPSVTYAEGETTGNPLLDGGKRLFSGGPVQQSLYSVLIEPGNQRGSEGNAIRNLVFIYGTQNVVHYLPNLKRRGQFRVYAGYAGWYPGQLLKEIRQGAWHVVPGDSRLIFDRQPSFVWRRLIERVLLE